MNHMRISGTFQLLSHLVHSEGTVSNVSKFRTSPVLFRDQIEEVPALSGNSIRGLLRRHSAAHLCNALGIKGQELPARLYYCLFSGGSLQKGVSQTGRDTGFFAQLRNMIPHLSLFGAAVAQEIMPGKLVVDWAYPICQETTSITGVESHVVAADLLESIRYTRLDDLEDKAEDTAAQQMIYEVEALIPGTILAHSFVLTHASDMERGAFYAVLNSLIGHPYLGGMSGKGHGRFSTSYTVDDECLQGYQQHLEEHREEIREYLLGSLGVVA